MIDGRRFLLVADALAEHEGEEFVRARIGRLYYAVWLEARSFCEEHLGYSRTGMAREHQAIASLLGTIDSAIPLELRALRGARNQADYDIDLEEVKVRNLLDGALMSSARVLARLEDLRETQ